MKKLEIGELDNTYLIHSDVAVDALLALGLSNQSCRAVKSGSIKPKFISIYDNWFICTVNLSSQARKVRFTKKCNFKFCRGEIL